MATVNEETKFDKLAAIKQVSGRMAARLSKQQTDMEKLARYVSQGSPRAREPRRIRSQVTRTPCPLVIGMTAFAYLGIMTAFAYLA